jgi:hypothetical protein
LQNYSGTNCAAAQGLGSAGFAPQRTPGIRVAQKISGPAVFKNNYISTGKGSSHLRMVELPQKNCDASVVQNCFQLHTVTPPLPVIAPVAPIVTQPGKIEIIIGSKSPELGKEKEGVKIPAVELPEIPQPQPNELATDYVSTLEERGFTNVSVNVLPDTSIDPSTGPDDVTAVDPTAGSRVAGDTAVRVDENPPNAPVATPPPVVPGVTEPGLNTPDFGVLCTKFPFGVPCWFVEEFSRWSTTAVVPKWAIPLEVPLLGWRTELKINLSFLEPAMEIVRPLLALMATIGLVMMFFHFALGGTGAPPGGDSEE